jgi:hypothetical protein
MNEKLRKYIIYAALGLAIIWGYYNIGSKKSSIESSERETREEILHGSKTTNIPDKLINVEDYQDLAWGRNPFQEPGNNAPRIVSHQTYWLLSGIIFSDNNPMAIINNKSLFIGESIDEAIVIDISRKEVTLDFKGKKLTLTVAKG